MFLTAITSNWHLLYYSQLQLCLLFGQTFRQYCKHGELHYFRMLVIVGFFLSSLTS